MKIIAYFDTMTESKSQRGDSEEKLSFALYNEKFELAKQMLESKVDINHYNTTYLSTACYHRNLKTITFLLEHKANPSKSDNITLDTPLHVAVYRNDVECMELLIKANAPIDVKNNQGKTPLHDATICGYKDCIELLLKHKADITIKNNYEKTAPDLAKYYEVNNDIINLLEFASCSTPPPAPPAPTSSI